LDSLWWNVRARAAADLDAILAMILLSASPLMSFCVTSA